MIPPNPTKSVVETAAACTKGRQPYLSLFERLRQSQAKKALVATKKPAVKPTLSF